MAAGYRHYDHPAGARVLLPSARGVRGGVHVGGTTAGNLRPVYVPEDLPRRHHLHVARTRMGKSTLMHQLLVHKLREKAAGRDGEEVVVVDPSPARCASSASPPWAATRASTCSTRASSPTAPAPAAGAPGAPDWMLPALLKPTEKRALGLIADWPWIRPAHLAALLGLGRSRLSETLQRLDDLGLLVEAGGGGSRRLALGDSALALLARRDRASAAAARRRWSAGALDRGSAPAWRDVAGRRSRQLLRDLAHTEAVHGFVAALAEQARASATEIVQLDPPHRASRYFPHHERLHSVQPDAFAILRRDDLAWPCFLEWERRAVHPATMAARLAPYLRYYASQRPTDDHGLRPTLLVVFGDELAAHHFLRVAQDEIARARVDLPLLVSSARTLREAGPLGRAWRAPGEPLRLAALLPGRDIPVAAAAGR